MHRSQSFRRFSMFDDSGNISFRRTLRNCSYGDAGFPERIEKFSSHAEPVDHAVAYHGDDATTLG
jgi:hypothetical protein